MNNKFHSIIKNSPDIYGNYRNLVNDYINTTCNNVNNTQFHIDNNNTSNNNNNNNNNNENNENDTLKKYKRIYLNTYIVPLMYLINSYQYQKYLIKKDLVVNNILINTQKNLFLEHYFDYNIPIVKDFNVSVYKNYFKNLKNNNNLNASIDSSLTKNIINNLQKMNEDIEKLFVPYKILQNIQKINTIIKINTGNKEINTITELVSAVQNSTKNEELKKLYEDYAKSSTKGKVKKVSNKKFKDKLKSSLDDEKLNLNSLNIDNIMNVLKNKSGGGNNNFSNNFELCIIKINKLIDDISKYNDQKKYKITNNIFNQSSIEMKFEKSNESINKLLEEFIFDTVKQILGLIKKFYASNEEDELNADIINDLKKKKINLSYQLKDAIKSINKTKYSKKNKYLEAIKKYNNLIQEADLTKQNINQNSKNIVNSLKKESNIEKDKKNREKEIDNLKERKINVIKRDQRLNINKENKINELFNARGIVEFLTVIGTITNFSYDSDKKNLSYHSNNVTYDYSKMFDYLSEINKIIVKKTKELDEKESELKKIKNDKNQLKKYEKNKIMINKQKIKYINKKQDYEKMASDNDDKINLDSYKDIITDFLNRSIDLARTIIKESDEFQRKKKKDIFFYYYKKDKLLNDITVKFQNKYILNNKNIKNQDLYKNINQYMNNVKSKNKNIIDKTFFPRIYSELNSFPLDKEIKLFLSKINEKHDTIINNIYNLISNNNSTNSYLENTSIQDKIKEYIKNINKEKEKIEKKYKSKFPKSNNTVFVYTYTDSIKIYFIALQFMNLFLYNY